MRIAPVVYFLLLSMTASCAKVDHCKRIEVKPNSGCKQTADGIHCAFLQPHSWGTCFEARDESLICQVGDKITRYSQQSKPTWTISAKSCPVLADQIKNSGQDQEMKLTIPIPLPVEPPKPTSQ